MDPAAQNPAPAAPVAPVAPVAPAPAAPAAPAPTAPVATDEDNEWAAAAKELAGTPAEKKEPTNEPPKPDEKTTTTETTIDPNETPEQKAERELAEAADKAEKIEPNAAARNARVAARESARLAETVRADVVKQMFADQPQTLQDADGDPINTIEDVQNLINPRTGENFTEEEAGMWLLSAQQQFNQAKAETEKKIDAIVDVNMDLKDQADAINYKYGAYLKANPELRDRLWAKFEQSLTTDESGVITGMPLALEDYYEAALDGRELPAAPATAAPAAPGTDPANPPAPAAPAPPAETAEEKAEREAKEKKDAAAKKQAALADRSDIYAPNNQPPADQEEDEWATAIKETYGPQAGK